MIKTKIKKFLYNNINNRFFGKLLQFIVFTFSIYVSFKTLLFIVYNFISISIFLKNRNKKEIIIVHDFLSSPPTIGDFLFNYFFARYFICKNYKVNLVIINNEYRDDWVLDKEKINNYIDTISKIINKLSENHENLNFIITDWTEFEKDYLFNKNLYIPFKDGVKKRFRLYNYSFNVLNYLLKGSKKTFIKEFLLDKNYFLNANLKMFKKRYITWHCRFDINSDLARNIDEKTFNKIYNILNKLYHQHEILIISDEAGCNLVKGWSRNYNLLFSKDFTNDFIGDISLILNSDFYFQFRGGGISLIPIFSNVPYLLIQDFAYINLPSKLQLTSYASKNQVVFNRNVLCEFSEEYFEKYTKIIK